MPVSIVYLILATDALAGALFVVLTSGSLPDSVASKFGAGGLVTAYMDKSTHIALMAGLAALIPMLMGLGFSWLPRNAPRYVKIAGVKVSGAQQGVPPALMVRLDIAAVALSSVTVLFLVALHWLIVEANLSAPARLSMSVFWPLIGVFMTAILAFTGWLSWSAKKMVVH